MVSKAVFTFISKIPGRNRKNLYVLLDNDTRIIGLNGLYDDPNEKFSLQGKEIMIELTNDVKAAVLPNLIFQRIFNYYGASGTVKKIGVGACINTGKCDVLFGLTKFGVSSRTTLSVSESYYEVFMLKPEPVNSSFYFVEEFSGTVWLSIFCTLVLLSFMMWAIARCLKRYVTQAPSITFADAVTENISAFSGQGFTIDSGSLTYRVFIFVVLMWNLMMSISYSTNLVSYLCAQRVPVRFNGLMDVLESREYSVCLFMLNRLNLQNALSLDDEAIKPYLPWIGTSKCSKNKNLLKKRMCKDKIAVLADTFTVRSLLEIHVPNCTIIALKEKYMATQNRIVLKSRSQYREQFNHVILLLQETGILKKINQDLYENKRIEEEVRRITSVEESHTSYIFIGYAFGMAVAIFIFLLEILINRLTRSRQLTRPM